MNENLTKGLIEPSLKKFYFAMNQWLSVEKYHSLLLINAIGFIFSD